ncbi:MAG: ankyrin repeat domain-containing protein, partial [Pirellulales bacterium]|nr:ankyrin repeat domain-containing protein [Pirellulales bacterium]
MRRLLNTITSLALTIAAGCNSAPSTDIWTAARDGDIDLLEQHVAAGTDINGTLDMPGNPADGGSPLHAAVSANQLQAIDFLIAQGAEVDRRDSNETGASPLMWAAAYGNLEAARRLIAAGAAVNYVDNNGATALDATLMFEPNKNRESKAEIAQLLRDKGGQSSLAPVSISDIWTAAATGNTAAISKHLDEGADVNGLEPTTRATPLIAAVTFGHTAAARLLLERQADLAVSNPDGNTALHLAALFAYPDTVRMLLKKGANAAARNRRGQTA